MSNEDSRPVVYCCTIKQYRVDYLLQNADIKLKVLTRTSLEDGTWKVLELEDKVYASQIEVMFTDLSVLARYRENLVNLRWAHTAANGVDVFMKALRKDEPFPNFKLTKTPGALNASQITEYVIGHIIAYERKLFEAKEAQDKNKWNRDIYTNSRYIPSLTIGILGIGQIGQHLAKICKGFGLTVWGLSRRESSLENRCAYVDVFRTTERLNDLLENCDYICNVLPSTPETRDLLSGDVLKACSCKKSIFINVGRGDVIDEQSIVNAIKNGWLSGAVLDVFREEPLPSSSPFWNLPGVIVTPHVSGWSEAVSYTKKITDFFIDNYQRYTEGLPLKGVLDWSQGY